MSVSCCVEVLLFIVVRKWVVLCELSRLSCVCMMVGWYMWVIFFICMVKVVVFSGFICLVLLCLFIGWLSVCVLKKFR